MKLGSLIDKTVKKQWSESDIKKYVGDYKYCALSYANDKETRTSAASGGTTSALLITGISQGLFDGAIICTTIIIDGKVRTKFKIATTTEEIVAAQGSKYVETTFSRDVIPLIEKFHGKLAVVGLPCDITFLKNRSERNHALKNKIALTIGLICGHNSRKELIDHVTTSIEQEEKATLETYKFRVGHWRGLIQAGFTNGKKKSYPTSRFNNYQNLFFFCERKCLACSDHYGYDTDISVGDVWLFKLKHDQIKKTGTIIRTSTGARLYQASIKSKVVTSEYLEITDILDGQSRIGPSHYNVSARSKVGKKLGISINDNVKEDVKWHQWMNAFITIANMKISENPKWQPLIFKIPKFFITIYLYSKKALETLK